MSDLWHFTCDHGHAAIGRRGMLKPRAHPFMPDLGPVVWLTTDPAPAPDDIGLTSTVLTCNRMGYRYRVLSAGASVVPWSSRRYLVAPDVVADLESYGRPETWWLSSYPVPVRLA